MSDLVNNFFRPSLIVAPMEWSVPVAGPVVRNTWVTNARRFAVGFVLSGAACVLGLSIVEQYDVSKLVTANADQSNFVAATPEAMTATLALIRAENDVDEAADLVAGAVDNTKPNDGTTMTADANP